MSLDTPPMLKDWIPFFQTLVWPLFLLILFVSQRSQVTKFIELLRERIRGGAEFSVGPEGVKIGAAPKLTEPIPEQKPGERASPDDLRSIYYLVHTAKYVGIVEGKHEYEISVVLDASTEDLLDDVSKVVYQLHRSYHRHVRESAERQGKFGIPIRAWGLFNLRADVYFKNGRSPLTLWRFLNF